RRCAPSGSLRPGSDEPDPGRFAAAPDYLAAPPGPRIARERHPDHARELARIVVQRDLRAGARDVLDQAMPCREPAVERDPGMLRQRLAGRALLGLWHWLKFSHSSASEGTLRNR